MDSDDTPRVLDAVNAALSDQSALEICGSGSKSFYGYPSAGTRLDMTTHAGILNYQPGELVITARSGTPLDDVEAALAERGQFLPFEPPHFGAKATLGGTIACGLSGPRRPWSGAARDLVLGMRMVNGRGQALSFGGEVMKNVAGYDVSRLMTGSMGTLGVILDISLKVLPTPEDEVTLTFELDADAALKAVARHARTPIPLTGAAFVDHRLYLRLAGASAGVSAARTVLGGEVLDDANFWHDLREQRLSFFKNGSGDLWRWSCPPTAPHLSALGDQLIDWGGAQRWFHSEEPAHELRERGAAAGGHLQCFRPRQGARPSALFHPMPDAVARLNAAVKHAFDPQGVFNPGRMGSEEQN